MEMAQRCGRRLWVLTARPFTVSGPLLRLPVCLGSLKMARLAQHVQWTESEYQVQPQLLYCTVYNNSTHVCTITYYYHRMYTVCRYHVLQYILCKSAVLLETLCFWSALKWLFPHTLGKRKKLWSAHRYVVDTTMYTLHRTCIVRTGTTICTCQMHWSVYITTAYMVRSSESLCTELYDSYILYYVHSM